MHISQLLNNCIETQIVESIFQFEKQKASENILHAIRTTYGRTSIIKIGIRINRKLYALFVF